MATHKLDPSPAETTYSLLIGGELKGSRSSNRFASTNPATGEKLADVPDADESDAADAVEAARRAFRDWWESGHSERSHRLRLLAKRLQERSRDYAMLDALDSGNPVASMRVDVANAVRSLEYFAGLAGELKGNAWSPAPGVFSHTVREPFGVVARIIPFNHPLMFAAARIAAPLAAGNTVVLKPAPQTPLSALELGRDVAEIFPPGVINIITGSGPRIGAALVQHPDVRCIGFTGSVETARLILRDAAAQIKTVWLELGGKNPMIVFPDADLDLAADSALEGANFKKCQGQSCGSTSRLFLHSKIHDEFLEKLIRRVEKIRIGSPTDEDTEMGCLVSEQQYNRVMAYIESGVQEKAHLLTGGGKPAGEQFQRGHFVLPTVFEGVTQDMKIAQEEIFGPVLSVIRWDRYEEMMQSANRVIYGLTASIWTRDPSLMDQAARDLQAGYVWINDSSRHYLGVPFGGYKQSGIGREESLDELLAYTQIKSVMRRRLP